MILSVGSIIVVYLPENCCNYRGIFPTTEQLNHHLALVTPDPRINHHQVQALQEQQYQIQEPRFGIPETAKFAELPQPRFIELPKPPIVESPDGNQQPKQ